MKFQKYPFEKLNELLDGITPNSNYSPISLTIGEPQFDTIWYAKVYLSSTLWKYQFA